jgi:hypothetical protein
LQHCTINSGLLSRQRFTTDLEFGRIISRPSGTERYLGCKQRIRSAVNDHIGIEPSP